MQTQKFEFLQALYEATLKNAITWEIVDDPERDVFQCLVNGERIEVELLYFQAVGDNGTTRGMVRIVGLGTDMYFAVGTEGYELIMKSLSIQIPGWNQGAKGVMEALVKATTKVRSLYERSFENMPTSS